MNKRNPALVMPALLLLSLVAAGPALAQTAQAAPPPAAKTPALAAVVLTGPVDTWAKAPSKDRSLFKKVDALIAKGSWKSGWDLLAAADPQHKDPWILARSVDLLLDGYLATETLRVFALADLPAGEKPKDKRGDKAGPAPDLAFEPLALAEAQAKAGVKPVPALDRSLGSYLAEGARLYPGAWILADQDIAAKVVEHLGRARAAGVWTAEGILAEGEALLNTERAAEAELLFAAAEKVDTKTPAIRYNHAVALLMLQRNAESLPLVEAGLLIDKDPASRLSGLGLGAQIAAQEGDSARVEAYISKAESESPDNPSPGLLRHELALRTGDAEGAAQAAARLMEKFGPKAQLIYTLVNAWMSAEYPAGALAFLDEGRTSHAADDEVAGIFGFYEVIVMLQTMATADDAMTAGQLLDETEARFAKSYPPEHRVFTVIKDLRVQVVQGLDRLAGPEAGPAAPETPPAPPPAAPSATPSP